VEEGASRPDAHRGHAKTPPVGRLDAALPSWLGDSYEGPKGSVIGGRENMQIQPGIGMRVQVRRSSRTPRSWPFDHHEERHQNVTLVAHSGGHLGGTIPCALGTSMCGQRVRGRVKYLVRAPFFRLSCRGE
jgi:hypothetical protein